MKTTITENPITVCPFCTTLPLRINGDIVVCEKCLAERDAFEKNVAEQNSLRYCCEKAIIEIDNACGGSAEDPTLLERSRIVEKHINSFFYKKVNPLLARMSELFDNTE